jgi:hypothetical protein
VSTHVSCPYDVLAEGWTLLGQGLPPRGIFARTSIVNAAREMLIEARKRLSNYNVLWVATDSYELAMSLSCGDES